MIWNKFFVSPGEERYHFGVDHEGFFHDKENTRFKEYLNLFKAKSVTKLNILVNNEKLFKSASGELPSDFSTLIQDLWGNKNCVLKCEENIIFFKGELKKFAVSLPAKMPSNFTIDQNVEVRETLSLIPYSATVINPDEPDARMLIKLLPYGALYSEDMGKDIDRPVIMLEKRRDEYIFKYFWDHLKSLWDKASNSVVELFTDEQIIAAVRDIKNNNKSVENVLSENHITEGTLERWQKSPLAWLHICPLAKFLENFKPS